MKTNLFVLCSLFQTLYGLRDENIAAPRILGGEDAGLASAPFMCSLQMNRKHFCGCVIISKDWALTAGACVIGQTSESIEAMAGTNARNGGIYHVLSYFIVHESYNKPTGSHDIALLRVKDSFKFNERVKPIPYLSDEVPGGLQLEIYGWGRLGVDDPLPINIQVAKTKSYAGNNCKTHESTLCAIKGAYASMCLEDRGGAAITYTKSGPALVGIVTSNNCNSNYMDTFAKISYLYSWIKARAV